MVHADYLFLMTDVDCLYDKNPRTNTDAQAIEVVDDVTSLEADVSSSGSSLGTGGMSTKIVAARLATSAGVTTVITRSSKPGNIASIINYLAIQNEQQDSQIPSLPATPLDGSSLDNTVSSLHADHTSHLPLHTRFLPDPSPIRDRSFWLLHGIAPRGTLYIDAGAHRAIANKAGLLPVGVIDVEGHFGQQEAVRLVVMNRIRSPTSSASVNGIGIDGGVVPVETTPMEVGRAMVNYSAAEIARIKGLSSKKIEGVLGYADSEYVAQRENVSLSKRDKGSRPVTPGPVGEDAVN